FQTYNLIPHQSVFRNVELALSIGGVPNSEKKERTKDALKRVGLEDHMYKKPNQLSGGQSQRVSIARALVNNPSIILADEPTGALDTETSIQIMEILKDISKDHLVIMVTHNPDLANRYATRIVNMLDGAIISDSDPVEEEEHEALAVACDEKRAALTIEEEKRLEKKASMRLTTSTALSASNLWSKKRKTFLTALASSIGLIGIATVLSVTNGMSAYINQIAMDSSALNYIMINSSTSLMANFSENMGAITSTLFGGEEIELEEYPDTDGVILYTEEDTTTSISAAPMELNDTFINYLESHINNPDDPDYQLVLGIDYAYSIALNLISNNNGTYNVVSDSDWQVLFNDLDYMETQYDILAGDSLPSEYNEVSLVVDKYNRISTQTLDNLGISYDTGSDILDWDSIVGKEIHLIPNDDFYQSTTNASLAIEGFEDFLVYSPLTSNSSQESLQKAYNSNGSVTIKITSVLRQKESAASTWLSSGIAYTPALTDVVFNQNLESEVVQYQQEHPEYDVLGGTFFSSSSGILGDMFDIDLGDLMDIFGSMMGLSTSSYDSNLALLGGDKTPSGITIYPKDMDSKDQILYWLDYWNSDEVYNIYGYESDGEGGLIADQYKITYMDLSATLVSMIDSIINIISIVLVAFSVISLVVSSIMIAIITYASVVERTKEIGTIRSLGGRKRDVSAVFIIEAIIIGLVSAAIALLVTWGIDALVNFIIRRMFGVSIAHLGVGLIFGIIGLGAGLNLIASIIPAVIAARKDPAVALRTE
ncbi:MAG: ATP-binding cassette domain-containing protein, partial [Coprobacillus sp.]|nr:ATP-binding cassette domain-containing protein [Coprobacillus sp.]